MAQRSTIPTPFPISQIADRYLLFDVDVISYVRREHNVCGVLIGTIPHLSQQNIFLGVPLELMPEEARLLVEQGHAYIANDVELHREGLSKMSRDDRLAFLQTMDKQGLDLAIDARRKAEEKTARALQDKGMSRLMHLPNNPRAAVTEGLSLETDGETTLFPSSSQTPSSNPPKLDPYFTTPTTSHPPLSPPPVSSSPKLPGVPHTYPLFRFLLSKGYFATPGLRFGCHYTIYPGDPLRFHSHFLATGLSWHEEFDLLDVVGGGRLGTGVKKAYLIGGERPSEKGVDDVVTTADDVRAFSIEWAGL